MADTCWYCDTALEGRQTTQLLCNHTFHTECFFTDMRHLLTTHQRELHDIHCVTCDALPFVAQGDVQDVQEEGDEEEDTVSVHSNQTTGAQGTRVLNLYTTNRVFRRDIKTYAHAVSSMSKPRKDLQKLIATKKTEVAEPYALIKAQYEGLYNTKKEEIVQSELYKTCKKGDARIQKLYTNLGTKYRVFGYHFPALSTVPGLKRLHRPHWRYYNRASSLIRRALFLRLRCW